MEGLLILEPETGTFRICRFSPEDPTTLGHNSIRSILKDNQGGMWIGTFYGGLNYDTEIHLRKSSRSGIRTLATFRLEEFVK